MNKYWILLIIIPIQLNGQSITGTILDSYLHQPVEFATIYISGTTIGTVSNNDGSFIIQSGVFPCKLIISHVSYNTLVINIDQYSKSDLLISIIPKVVEMSEVTIVDENLREKNIQHFKDEFLGTDVWGKNANLGNDSVLIFTVEYYNENTDDSAVIGKLKLFKVEATTPLNINLPLLGYYLQYELISFIEKYNPALKRNIINTSGYCYFKPVDTDSKLKARSFKRNRLRAYYFSPQHFTRSLYNKKLPENGYFVHEILNADATKRPILRNEIADSCMSYISDEAVITGLKDHSFIIRYCSDRRGIPLNLDETDEFPSVEISSIYFINNECIIRKDGTRPGESIIFGPGLGDKRVGATLPDNYNPEE